MISAEEILELYARRKKDKGVLFSRMQEIKEHYEGDVIVPLPEIDKADRPFVAQQIITGIDQGGMRIASTQPNLFFPPIKEGVNRSEELSRKRRQANLGWWENSQMDIKDGYRARHLIAYASSPVQVYPDLDMKIPVWKVLNPLQVFPSDTEPDEMTPDNVIIAQRKPLWWLKRNYGIPTNLIRKGTDPRPDDMFDFLEYIDGQEWVQVIVGRAKTEYPFYTDEFGHSPAQVAERTVNLSGICPVVIPGRITLGRSQGQFDGMTGIFQMRAKLMALEVIAIQRGIFPPAWVVSRPNETAKVINVPRPAEGIPGVIQGGDIKDFNPQPSYLAYPTIDRLERAEKLEGGIPSEYQGESGSNIRTGKRGDAVFSAIVDPPIAEAQKLLARSKEHENKRAIAIAKGYFGKSKKSFYVSWKGAKGHVDYVPNETFETDVNIVSYSLPGADINNQTIAAGQLIGTKLASRKSMRRLHPLIEEPDLEDELTDVEALEDALLQGIQQRLAAGEMSPLDAVRLIELRKKGKSLVESFKVVDEEASKRQASVTAEGAPDTAIPGSPEAQPGLAPPGVGAEVPAAIPEGSPSLENLSQLLFSLRAPQRMSPAERSA